MPEDHGKEHGEHLADIGAQQKAHHFADIGIDTPALSDSVDNGGKIIVGEGHIRRALGHVRTGDAHGTADISSLQGGSIVDAVAGHGDHLTTVLPGLDNADLILRGNTGIHGDVLHLLVQLLIAHGVQLGAGDGPIPLREDPQLFGNGRCRHHVVSGDHHRLDPRLTAQGHSLLGLRPGRVDHTHQAQQGQAVLQLLAGELLGQLVQLPVSHRQHPQGLTAHLVIFLPGRFQIPLDAPGRHHVKGALDNGNQLPVYPVDGGHQLSVRVKGQLRQTGILLAQGVLLHAVLVGRHQNGCLGGIANMLLAPIRPKGHRAITAQRAVLQQLSGGRAVLG